MGPAIPCKKEIHLADTRFRKLVQMPDAFKMFQKMVEISRGNETKSGTVFKSRRSHSSQRICLDDAL